MRGWLWTCIGSRGGSSIIAIVSVSVTWGAVKVNALQHGAKHAFSDHPEDAKSVPYALANAGLVIALSVVPIALQMRIYMLKAKRGERFLASGRKWNETNELWQIDDLASVDKIIHVNKNK